MTIRRTLVQVHLWTGVLIGLYLTVVSLTGALLVFRIDLQRLQYPHLFIARRGAPLDAATILERVQQAFPAARVSGVDAPTGPRPTYLAYVLQPDRFLTLFVEPVSGTILGELPTGTWIRTVQDLHFDLLGGRTGRRLNGAGAALLLVLCITGLTIWWPRRAAWRRALVVNPRHPWKRIVRDAHGAVGIWSVSLLAVWAVTGLCLAFPVPFRAALNAIAPLTVTAAPQSRSPGGAAPPPSWRALIDAAGRQVPDQHVARVVTPSTPRAAFLVMFAATRPTPPGAFLTSVYLDQYSGEVLVNRRHAQRSSGDVVLDSVTPLHTGNTGGRAVQALWVLFALAAPALFATGLMMWWTKRRRRDGLEREMEGA